MNIDKTIISREEFDHLIATSCRYQGDCVKSREATRSRFKTEEKDPDFTIRLCVDGVLASIMYELGGVEHEEDEKTAFQVMLCVAFTRAYYIINDMCLTGDYSEAVSLQRRQLEIVLRLLELERIHPSQIKKKAPHVGNIEKASVGQLYGMLSEYTHLCTDRINDLLTEVVDGRLRGPSLLPRFSNDASGACIDTNLIITLFYLREALPILERIYPDIDLSREKDLLIRIFYLAYKHELIKVEDISDFDDKEVKRILSCCHKFFLFNFLRHSYQIWDWMKWKPENLFSNTEFSQESD